MKIAAFVFRRLFVLSLLAAAYCTCPAAEPVKITTKVNNRLVTARPIVFVVRNQYPGDHHNTATMFQTGEINEGKFRGPGAEVLHV